MCRRELEEWLFATIKVAAAGTQFKEFSGRNKIVHALRVENRDRTTDRRNSIMHDWSVSLVESVKEQSILKTKLHEHGPVRGGKCTEKTRAAGTTTEGDLGIVHFT